MKKIISLIITICLLFSIVSTQVYATEDTSVSTGYINTVNAKTLESKSYQGIRKNEAIYMLPNDIATICGYECNSLSLERQQVENVLHSSSFLSQTYSKLNLDKLFENNKFEYLLFSRKDTTTDYITQVYYCDGYAQTMNKSFEIDTVNYDGKTYLNLEKMLYLMHAQWCVEESILYCYPLDYNIFDFIGENFSYMYDNSVQHNSLLYESENKWGHSTRVVLSHILNDVDMRIFIPFYGSDIIQQDWYEEAILQLATTDDSFIDDYGSAQISKHLEDSNFQKVKIDIDVSGITLDTIIKIPDAIQKSKLSKFSKWSDFSDINTTQLSELNKKIGAFGDFVSFSEMLLDFNEINTRSIEWGNDFVNGLNILYTINEDVYGDYGKDILTVAENLLNEYENPTKEATKATILDSCEMVVDKLLDNTVVGRIESIITLSNAIIKSNPNYKSQIENADLMNTVHALVNVENVYLNEFVDAYHDYLHYLGVEEGTSSLRLWELMFAATNDNPQKKVEIHAISDMRNTLEMFLKTSLRNKTYVYHFNCFNNGGSLWTPTMEAKELEEDIYKTYALLSELIISREYDNWIYLDETFETMHSNEPGLIREAINNNLLTSEKVDFENENSTDIEVSVWQNILTDGYWENKIQAHYIYRFFENGEVKSYPANFDHPIVIEDLIAEDTYTYTIEDDYLVINDLNVRLKYVSKDDDYNWDIGIEEKLPTNEKFFYEVDFVVTEAPDNAFYLSKFKELPDSNTSGDSNWSVAELRKEIIGSWGALGSIAPEYNFIDEKNCSGEMPWQSGGTYSISNDKMLTISWAGKSDSEEYIWTSESWDEFYSHNEYGINFWYMTENGVLILNGKEKYRDGVDNFTYNNDGDLMNHIVGKWISDNGHIEYQINSDGTWVKNMVTVAGGVAINRTELDNGKIEIIDNVTAKLWQEVDSLSQIPGATELIFDDKNDKISVGDKNNTYKRAKYNG